jgi:hypothetical protein
MRVPDSPRCLLAPLCAVLAMLAGASTSRAQVVLGLPDDPTPAAQAAPQLAPDGVRSGMAAIRKLVLDAHTLITHRRLSPEQARRFAKEVKQHVILLQSVQPTPAFAEILTSLSEGAAEIAGPVSGTSQLDGLDKIETALARYPQVFDDPDWKPLR